MITMHNGADYMSENYFDMQKRKRSLPKETQRVIDDTIDMFINWAIFNTVNEFIDDIHDYRVKVNKDAPVPYCYEIDDDLYDYIVKKTQYIRSKMIAECVGKDSYEPNVTQDAMVATLNTFGIKIDVDNLDPRWTSAYEKTQTAVWNELNRIYPGITEEGFSQLN